MFYVIESQKNASLFEGHVVASRKTEKAASSLCNKMIADQTIETEAIDQMNLKRNPDAMEVHDSFDYTVISKKDWDGEFERRCEAY